MIPGLRQRILLRLAPLFLLLLGAAAAVRADPPARVARIGDAEGSVSFAPAGDTEWTDLQRNRPLTRGDRLWTDRGTRAEMQVGSSAVRIDGQTRLAIVTLDDRSTQLSVTQGSVYVHLRSLADGENFEVDTPNLAWRAVYPGDYRIDVDSGQGTTRVTIHAGTGAVFGENGQTLQLGGGQQVTFRSRALAQVASQESPPDDAFDRWSVERNRREDQSIAARYVPREVVGYQQLDPYGQWRRDANYGAIWFPQAMPANWAPYRQGHWSWIEPWGWTWVDDAPWGFAPFHYGRWALVDGHWAWAPGRLSVQPVYAPALVAFVGGGNGEVTWFPLAPNEAWQPPYAASALYISNVNRNIPLAPVSAYAYQRKPEALSAIAPGEFDHGRPAGTGWWRVAANLLTTPPIVPPPPMPERALAAARASAVARSTAATAPPSPPVQPALAQPVATPALAAAPGASQRTAAAVAPATAAAPAPSQRTAAVAPALAKPGAAIASAVPAVRPMAARAPQPQPQPQLQAHVHREPTRVARPVREPARVTVQAKAAPRTIAAAHRREPHAARERVHHEEAAARAAQGQRVHIARREAAEKARRVAQARREEQVRLAQARREEQARRLARAHADDQLRREMHASQVEQARRVAARDAQALRQQRLQREAQLREVAQERDGQPLPPAAPIRDQGQPVRRGRPDLRREAPPAPEVWQRGVPLVNQGPTS
jgi:hypothetical protein